MAGDPKPETRPPKDRLWGADRAILYLEAPVKTLDGLDGSRENDFRKEAKKFLDSPAAAFDKHPADYVGHVRELGSKTRAFGTWCQNKEMNRELCVVHEIYRKENESAFWVDLDDYNQAGEEFARGFSSFSPTKYNDWIAKLQASPDVEVVTSQ